MTEADPAPWSAGTIGARHTSLRDQVLEELRDRIVDGGYAPGERLTEDRLAADFGVSRNPVREALRVMEAEGFVYQLPRRGVVVATPDETTMRDMFLVRRQWEGLAARLAAERAGRADVEGLWRLLDDGRRATEAGDLRLLAELNSALHRRIIEVGGNRWLVALSAPMYRHVQWVFRLTAADRAPHSWTEHVTLVEAISTGDGEAAELAAAQHVDAAAAAALGGAEHCVEAVGNTGRSDR
ncbi:DNA-binding transcriptional regulator, GntR family [Modestobacter sp. DSM 44400]|uniref:GntR family transcriptional regulator n=1 Tax=Modestobacter sp. DSM 44400 TaxID=1550230 RepID=UPI000894CB71|nr:GntR family transcriptional regulator [Modestobacter sp. DSM 44400]SDY29892.1 DNA-binding transcriptional regulator, GntR family [Modestobacter sp. DSM 44400]